MDLKHPTTKLSNPENETPPTKLSFSNGKTHHHHHPPYTAAIYKECLKNHAASIGGHALDGCGEFMPSTSPLTCAACGCHRNFHRREPTTTTTPPIATERTHFIDFHRPSPSPPSTNLLLSLTTAADAVETPGTPVAMKINGRNNNKRFRTKFSQDQKEKMMGFAERIGWKMQRSDDKLVMDFCNSIGIKRAIFKVWMHNNKSTFGINKKDTTTTTTTTATTTAVAGALVRSNDQENASGGDVHFQDSTNGSSSSS